MTQAIPARSAKTVGSARNATRILDYLTRQETPVRLTDVVGTLGINSSTCFNILHTLAEDGFVLVRDRTYAPGPRLVHLAYRVLETVDDFSRIHMLIERFALDHRLSVVLWRLDGSDAVAMSSFADPSALLAVNVTVQRRMPMLTGSVGRVIAGFMPIARDRLTAEFARAGWPNLSLNEFIEQAAEAKRDGYAVERGDFIDGIHAMAAPVFAPGGTTIRIVSVYALASDLPHERMPGIGDALIRLASEIGFFEQDKQDGLRC